MPGTIFSKFGNLDGILEEMPYELLETNFAAKVVVLKGGTGKAHEKKPQTISLLEDKTLSLIHI